MREVEGTGDYRQRGPARPPGSRRARRNLSGPISRVVASMGQAEFPVSVAHACTELYDADQVTIFMLEDGYARCILAHRPSDQRLVRDLCSKYTRSFVGRDPLLWRHLESEEKFMTHGIVSSDIRDKVYWSRLFYDVGLAGKVAAISTSRYRTLYINLYYSRHPQSRIADTLKHLGESGRILATCLQKHEDLTGGSFRAGSAKPRVDAFLGERFKCLSTREREVCALIVCGYSVEAIALEMKVSESTVITFRKRAYAKLSIASRGELFAHCAGLVGAL